MKILAISHFLWFSGAQISTLEFLNEVKYKVKDYDIELKVVICKGSDNITALKPSLIHIEYYEVPCQTIMGYPIMDIESVQKLIEWANVVWITDEIYLVASRVKRLRRVPIVAHLHSYALICPWWAAFYGFREMCSRRCSPWRIVKCKQSVNLERSRIGLLSDGRARIYWLLDFIKGPFDFFRWRKLMDGVLDGIDGFIAVSKTTRDIHVEHLPELESKSSAVIYNPVTEPLKYIRPDPGEPYGNYLLYASGSNPVKGPHLLLEAWSAVSKEFRDLRLYMVGCKNSWVENIAKKMNLKNVVFTEKLPSETYYQLMYRARAVVMPSLWPEPFGRIPVVANRLGVPAVVSSAGGLPETIVDGVTGYVFKSSDSEELAEKVAKVLERDFDRGSIVKHSYERVNPQREIEKIIRFFEEVSGSGKS